LYGRQPGRQQCCCFGHDDGIRLWFGGVTSTIPRLPVGKPNGRRETLLATLISVEGNLA
jgi:hypothetical protein